MNFYIIPIIYFTQKYMNKKELYEELNHLGGWGDYVKSAPYLKYNATKDDLIYLISVINKNIDYSEDELLEVMTCEVGEIVKMYRKRRD